MALTLTDKVLAETLLHERGLVLRVRQTLLVIARIAFLAVAAKITVRMWPVPITIGTFAVLTIGAAHGPRLGVVTILGYLAVGTLGFDVFAGSSAEVAGLTCMMGSTGGYLVGCVLAVIALGLAARDGWDRSIGRMALAMLAGNALIYVPGRLWLGRLYGWNKPVLAWGLRPFLVGDALKLGLAALRVPGRRGQVGCARGRGRPRGTNGASPKRARPISSCADADRRGPSRLVRRARGRAGALRAPGATERDARRRPSPQSHLTRECCGQQLKYILYSTGCGVCSKA